MIFSLVDDYCSQSKAPDLLKSDDITPGQQDSSDTCLETAAKP